MKLFTTIPAIILSSAILSPSSFGQAISVNGGSIQGTITDSSGASIPNAAITVTNKDTGAVRQLSTDGAGFYSIGPLIPGNYSLTIISTGFQKETVNTVIRTGTASPGSFKLTVGSASDTVEVTEGAVQVNTDQIQVSDVITQEQIKSLPVNGRNFLDLAQIEPGVILQSGESFDPTKAGYSAISVGGVSGRTTRILLDGQDITDETVGTTIFNVSEGAISEFQLNRSTQDVSGDVTSSGLVLVSTNTGTNKVHGEAFYYFQDHRALFARSENGVDAPFQRNQFGGSVGGPIVKDKLFFFGNIERIKQDSSSVSPVLTGSSALFSAIATRFPLIPSPYRETYSTIRLDYTGPLKGHYFVRGNYNVNSVASNFGLGYALYANRDNTPGIAGGADFVSGKFTHSIRGSYEKFHNLISDQTAGNNSLYNGVPSIFLSFASQGLRSGPNYLAPQGTFQSDKQVRYDGTWTKGAHLVRFGYSINRILGGGFAAFFGLSPYGTESTTTLLSGVVTSGNPFGFGCNNVVGAAPCPNDPANGYHINTAIIGNGQGSFTENPGFGLPGSGIGDYREGAYVSDTWKVTPHFSLTAGVRWSVDTGRANQDITNPTCADVNTAAVGTPCTGTQSLFAQYNPILAGAHVHTSYGNFGPQIGINYSPGDQKTSFRGGIGIYYESDVFNNTTNARSSLIQQGALFDDRAFCAGGGTFNVTYADPTTGKQVPHLTTPDGTNIRTLCYSSSALAGPEFAALQQAYQASTRANAISSNGGFIGNTLNVQGIYGTPYRTPYSVQYNFAVERQIFKGGVVSANYLHNSTIHISQSVDQNHIGAARFLNAAAARNAIVNTVAAFPQCPQGSTAPSISCAIANGATIASFAGNGLDSGTQYLGSYNAVFNGVTPDTGAAFPGQNAALGAGNFLLPIGRSGYDALQLVFKQQTAHPVRGIDSATFQGSYSRSRIVGSSAGGSDQFFSNGSIDNDNPNEFIGRVGLDHSNEVSFGTTIKPKYSPTVGIIGHFYSAPPSTLTLDSTQPTGGIFQSDVTGDGTIGDVAPGTVVGNFQHGINGRNLAGYITNFNATQAGRLTPAGQALVAAGLFTQAQLVASGGTIQPIAQLPQATGLNNPAFRSLDINFAYLFRLARFREGLSLEPRIAFYNVFNFSNFASPGSGILLNQANAGGPTNTQSGYLTGPNSYSVLNGFRSQRGSGTFDQGAPRTAEFQLLLNF